MSKISNNHIMFLNVFIFEKMKPSNSTESGDIENDDITHLIDNIETLLHVEPRIRHNKLKYSTITLPTKFNSKLQYITNQLPILCQTKKLKLLKQEIIK